MHQAVVHWLIHRTPSCQKTAELLSDTMDRPLPLSQRFSLRLHFILCAWCQRYGMQLRLLRRAMRHLAQHLEAPSVLLEPSLSPAARERLKRALEDGLR